jgi:hypothetical protein
MNPLEALKQKLRVKPVVEEKERVAVVIKGEQKKRAEPKKRVAREKSATDIIIGTPGKTSLADILFVNHFTETFL